MTKDSSKTIIKRAKSLTKKQKTSIVIGLFLAAIAVGIISGLIYRNHQQKQAEIKQQEQAKLEKKIDLVLDDVRQDSDSADRRLAKIDQLLSDEKDKLTHIQQADILVKKFLVLFYNDADYSANQQQIIDKLTNLTTDCDQIEHNKQVYDAFILSDKAIPDQVIGLMEQDLKLMQDCHQQGKFDNISNEIGNFERVIKSLKANKK